jgi:hypothetical protein
MTGQWLWFTMLCSPSAQQLLRDANKSNTARTYAVLNAELLLYVNSVSLYLQLPVHRNSSPNALVRCNSTGSQWWLLMSHRWCRLRCGMRWATSATTLHLCSPQLVAGFSKLRANSGQPIADNDSLELQQL